MSAAVMNSSLSPNTGNISSKNDVPPTEVDLIAYPTAQKLVSRCRDFFSEVEDLTPGHELEAYLNKNYGPGNPVYENLCDLTRQGLKEGWVANFELDGAKYRRSKVLLPSAENRFFSITTVYMKSEEEYSGQYHSHPYGEINCVVQVDKTAELKGMQGWQGAGWTSPGPVTNVDVLTSLYRYQTTNFPPGPYQSWETKQNYTLARMEEVFEKMLPIFCKAVNTPEQLSREEKNVLQYRLSPQKEDAAIKARTSNESFEDLVKKCLVDGVSTLTDDELKILSEGVQPLPLSTLNALMEIQEKQTAEVQAVIEQAYKNITDPDEKNTSLAAHEEIDRRVEVARAERRAQRASQPRRTLERSARARAAARNAPYPNGAIKWASEAIQRYALKSQTTNLQTFPDDGIWGFACLRTSYDDDATWDSFRQRLDSKIQQELQRHLVPEAMQKGFRLVYLENETELAGGLE
ncbi:hypothetical protein KCU66_g8658, partial [Aureobasidium melanogenum]